MKPIRVAKATGKFAQEISVGSHKFLSDVVIGDGGEDQGPSPHEYLAAALGACTAMTLQVYARRKDWPLENAEIDVDIKETPGNATFERKIRLIGPLDETQRKRLLEIADHCPVHKTLSSTIKIETTLL
jgi:putative redox protein